MGELESISLRITDRAKDYLRAIRKIIDQQGFARTGDVASELEIKPASAFEMLCRLKKLVVSSNRLAFPMLSLF
jgi:Mn-dependent DtxR family transcriptional regulator